MYNAKAAAASPPAPAYSQLPEGFLSKLAFSGWALLWLAVDAVLLSAMLLNRISACVRYVSSCAAGTRFRSVGPAAQPG